MDYKWNIVDIFNVDRINQWYLSKQELLVTLFILQLYTKISIFKCIQEKYGPEMIKLARKIQEQRAKIAKVKCEPKVFKF